MRVRRVDLPAPELLEISLGRPRQELVLVGALTPGARGVAVARQRTRGEPAGSFVRKLRKELAGGAVEDVQVLAGALVVRVRRGDRTRSVAVELEGRGNVILLDEADRVIVTLSGAALGERGIAIGDRWTPPVDARLTPPRDFQALVDAGEHLGVDRLRTRGERRRVALDRALRKALRRLDRRLDAIAGDAARAVEVEPLRRRANALLGELHRIPEGATEVRVTAWWRTPPEEVTVAIDPALGPKGTIDAMFHRARRLERGAGLAGRRLVETQAERAAIAALRDRLTAVDPLAGTELEALAEKARRLGVRGAREAVAEGERAAGPRPPPRRKPYRQFRGHGDRPILVGRGAADNDALTLGVGKPSDLWLHARGHTGAHVIVPLGKKEACPPELLIDAAHLAAHFSDARGEALVEVQHTLRRYLRKPKGAAPGLVRVGRDKTLTLRVDPRRLSRLLATEER